MRALAVTPVLVAGLLLAGCDWAGRVSGHVNPGSMSLAERCAAMMQAAIPYADIDIGKSTSQNRGVSTILAHVEGTRTDHPNTEGIARNLTADCEFNDTALVSFHLTGIGPEH
ncbi:MAG TPA: hypothetical protein VN808_10080 [Stellaceae bacterium]|nr:hypothetical protein [Stellaceae bacterium]